MERIFEVLNSMGMSFVAFAGPMLIQSSLLILILLGLTWLLKKRVRAVWLYGLWMLLLVKLVTPVSLSLPLSIGGLWGDVVPRFSIQGDMDVDMTPSGAVPQGSQTKQLEAYDASMDTKPTHHTLVTQREQGQGSVVLHWQGLLFLGWLVVVVGMMLWMVQRVLFVRGLVAQAKTPDSSWEQILKECYSRMGGGGSVRLKLSPNATSPAVCGLIRPVILVPQDLEQELDQSRLEAILMHELAHVQRGDLWINLLQTVLQILYFYNPLLWFANAVIRAIREKAVDETVMVAMGDRADTYPETLIHIAKMAFGRPTLGLRLIGVVEKHSLLRERIKHMLNRPVPKKAKMGALGMVSLLLVGCLLLPMAGAADKQSDIDYQHVTVKEGVGFGEISVNHSQCTLDFVKSKFGVPEEEKERFLNYRSKYGLDFYFRPNNQLSEIRMNQGFRGKLSSGITMQSRMEDVFREYGEPIDRVLAPNLRRKNQEQVLFTMEGTSGAEKVSRIYYGCRGMLFWFKGDGINQMVVFPAHNRALTQPQKVANSLQSMIDEASPGDTVIVPDGEYTEPVSIRKPLTLKGSSVDACRFKVAADVPAIFADARGKGRVIIENLSVEWQLATSDKRIEYPCAVVVKDSEGGAVKNCRITALGSYRRSPLGLRISGFSDVTISDCYLGGFEYVVQFMEGTLGTIQDCVINDCGHQGVINYANSTMKVLRNIFANSRYHAIRCTGGTVVAKDNLLINNKNRGVYLGNKSCAGEIRNNLIIGSGSGIGGFSHARVHIANNVIKDCTYAGIGSRSTCRLTIEDNILMGNPRGVVVFQEDDQSGHNLTLNTNTYFDNETDVENIEKAVNSIMMSPEFTDPEDGDFTLPQGAGDQHGLSNPQIIQTLWKKWKQLED